VTPHGAFSDFFCGTNHEPFDDLIFGTEGVTEEIIRKNRGLEMDEEDGRDLNYTWLHLPAKMGGNGLFDFYASWSFSSILHQDFLSLQIKYVIDMFF
jgi:hypothetical protein